MAVVAFSDRAATVQHSLCGNISGLGFFGCLECAKVNLGVVVRYACSKSRAILENSENACGLVVPLCFTLVLNVLRLRYIAQVFKTIVRSIAIDMVNLTLWPASSHVQPCQSMALVQFAVNRRDDIAIPGHTAGNLALRNSWLLEPSRENSSIRAVIKDLS